MNKKTKELINLIFKKLKKNENLEITKNEVEQFVLFLINN